MPTLGRYIFIDLYSTNNNCVALCDVIIAMLTMGFLYKKQYAVDVKVLIRVFT